jgi:hypothetical protein
MLDMHVPAFSGKRGAPAEETLGDFGLTLSEIDHMSLN